MNEVEVAQRPVTQSAGLNELERVPRLRIEVHSDYLGVREGPVVAHGGAAGTTEQIKNPHQDSLVDRSAPVNTPGRLY